MQFTTGDKVTCRQAVSAFYSGYAGRPEQAFEPGMVGTVATMTPARKGRKGWPAGYCVDFTGAAYGSNPATWRAYVLGRNLKKVR